MTSGYWSVLIGEEVRDGDQDLAWAYDFPTRQLQPTAGLVAFYSEKIGGYDATAGASLHASIALDDLAVAIDAPAACSPLPAPQPGHLRAQAT